MKHKFNDYGSIKSSVQTLNMRLNSNAIPLDSKYAFSLQLRIISSTYQWTWKRVFVYKISLKSLLKWNMNDDKNVTKHELNNTSSGVNMLEINKINILFSQLKTSVNHTFFCSTLQVLQQHIINAVQINTIETVKKIDKFSGLLVGIIHEAI